MKSEIDAEEKTSKDRRSWQTRRIREEKFYLTGLRTDNTDKIQTNKGKIHWKQNVGSQLESPDKAQPFCRWKNVILNIRLQE